MKTIILCGGRGMRLQEETEFRPKPLVPIGGRPILSHIMNTYAHYGFREFILCLGYRGEMIKECFLNYEAMSSDFTIRLGQRHSLSYDNSHKEQDFVITLADTGLETMTGGRIKRVEKYTDGEVFMVTYGNGVGFRAVIKRSDGWWIGWLVDLPRVNAQEKTKGKLLESLRIGAEDMLMTTSEPEDEVGLVTIRVGRRRGLTPNHRSRRLQCGGCGSPAAHDSVAGEA